MTQPLMPSSAPCTTSVSEHARRYTSAWVVSEGIAESKTNWRGPDASLAFDAFGLGDDGSASSLPPSISHSLLAWQCTALELAPPCASASRSAARTAGRTRTKTRTREAFSLSPLSLTRFGLAPVATAGDDGADASPSSAPALPSAGGC